MHLFSFIFIVSIIIVEIKSKNKEVGKGKMLNKKDLKILESLMMLYAVKRCHGKKSAAKDLNTSIDTLNKYLENLEEELGVKLLIVHKHQCELTNHGKKAVEVAEKIRSCLAEVYRRAGAEDDTRGEIKIAYERNAYLPEFRNIYKIYPQISFCFDIFETISNVKSYSYDIFLCNSLPKEEDFVVVYAKEIPCRFFASKNYLAQHGFPKDCEDLIAHHKLILKEDFLEQLCIKSKKAFFLVSNNSFLLKEAVVHDAGIGVLPFGEIEDNKNLVCLKDIPCRVKCFLYLISDKRLKDKPRVRNVLNYYKKSLQEMNFSDFEG